ncbi:hypothetical protein AVEN_245996-1 [Araneus ventricosus]|uniref:Uncharacterized protein n=1 Tax=Araneus ventricosus TaxID=182803 RepID=A0A4Y2FKF0_ARAVE|nr:hypothetical protein AVEN_245996-1 [Araneus ventricosus]
MGRNGLVARSRLRRRRVPRSEPDSHGAGGSPSSKPDSPKNHRESGIYTLLPTLLRGRGGLVIRSRLWGRRVPISRPDSTEDPPSMGPVAR